MAKTLSQTLPSLNNSVEVTPTSQNSAHFWSLTTLAIYGLIFMLGLVLRLWHLGIIPAAIHHDEGYYAAEAQTIKINGTDLTGNWRPWYLTPAHILYAELPGTIMSTGFWLTSNPLLAFRLSSVVMGMLLSAAMAWFSWGLFRNRTLTLVTFIFALFNPWIFQFSRMNFDAIYSLAFYFLGLAVLVNTKKWMRLAALLPLALGFFQYQGLKLLFLPMIGALLLYLAYQDLGSDFWRLLKLDIKVWKARFTQLLPLIVVGGISLLVMGTYLIRLQSQSAGNRLNDIIFFNDALISRLVDEQRRLSLSNPLEKIFINKATVIGWEMLYRYLHAFHPIMLFNKGEVIRNPFSVWSIGIFHLTDVVFMLIGLVVAWLKPKYRAQIILLSFLIVVAPLPLAINTIEAWIMFRASFLFPLLVLLTALGFTELWRYKNYILRFGLVGVYSLSLAWFGYQYFYRYPVYSASNQAFGERVMSSYVKRLSPETDVHVLGDQAAFIYYSYLLYSQQLTPDTLAQVQTSATSDKYHLNKVTIATDCIDYAQASGSAVIISDAANVACKQDSKMPAEMRVSNIAAPIDSGAVFKVFNDTLCSEFNLPTYLQIKDLKYLDLDSLSNQEFCENLLTRQP